jgi:hypothetical protein
MANHMNVNEAAGKLGRGARRTAAENTSARWRPADAARFFFKGQCYDAGPESDTTCSLCGKQIRLCYVLQVLEAADLLSPEVGKLTVGECCFQPILAVNEKLHCQLLAAAVNLRTYIEAIDRDQRIFADRQAAAPSGKVELPRLEIPGPELVRQLFEAFVNDGGDHA